MMILVLRSIYHSSIDRRYRRLSLQATPASPVDFAQFRILLLSKRDSPRFQEPARVCVARGPRTD